MRIPFDLFYTYNIYVYTLAMVTENNFLNNTSDGLALLACVKDDLAEPTAKAHTNYKALWGGALATTCSVYFARLNPEL